MVGGLWDGAAGGRGRGGMVEEVAEGLVGLARRRGALAAEEGGDGRRVTVVAWSSKAAQ